MSEHQWTPDDEWVLGNAGYVWDAGSDPAGLGPHAEPDLDAIAPLAAALDAAGRGGLVFPCHTPTRDGGCTCRRACRCNLGKHPRTARGLLDASGDPATIRRWWGTWPAANVALRTGAVSGVVVLDVDKDGFAALEALCAHHGQPGWCPDTPTVATGGGGLHLHLAHPGLEIRIKTTAGVLAPGVDVRADGGYAILPPSLHASGARYEWAAGYAPWETALALIPPWLRALLVDPPRPSRPTAPSAPGAVGESNPIREGQRNTTLTSLAGSMRRSGFSEPAIAAALAAENTARCQPPLDTDEVETIAASVARYAPEPPPIVQGHGLRVREVRRA